MSTTKNTPKTETTYNNKMEGSSNGPHEISMSDLASLASYFSGSIEKMDNEKFERGGGSIHTGPHTYKVKDR
jgi:hypothetical protein